MLSLDIEWLLGVCFATRSPADHTPEWPPQPDRIFSALVASWSARGARPDERVALEWLESLLPPQMQAAPRSVRESATVFVPPNDAAANDIRILPARRRRQPRRFPAVTLPQEDGRPHLRLSWQAEPAPDWLAALSALARDTSYIGHSSSLVRCNFVHDAPGMPSLEQAVTTAAPYSGRLRELESLHARYVTTADPAARPRPARLAHPNEPIGEPTPETVFGERWMVLEYVAGARPDIRAAAVIGRTMRDALMSVWPEPIPEWLSGHAPDGTPSRDPHLAVIPLGNIGFPWSDGCWHGLAIVLPRAIEDKWTGAETPEAFAHRQQFQSALFRLAEGAPERDTIALRLSALGVVQLRLVTAPEKQSLRPRRYLRANTLWSTATPIALDRHAKTAHPREETAEMITEGCTRIGLPAPAYVNVHKHPAIMGAPSAWPARGSPSWAGWVRPRSLATRPLTHATLRFASPVAGPIIIGAGRFFGLGLCLPIENGRA